MKPDEKYDWSVCDSQGVHHTIKATGEPMYASGGDVAFVNWPEGDEDEDVIALFYSPASVIRGEKVSG